MPVLTTVRFWLMGRRLCPRQTRLGCYGPILAGLASGLCSEWITGQRVWRTRDALLLRVRAEVDALT